LINRVLFPTRTGQQFKEFVFDLHPALRPKTINMKNPLPLLLVPFSACIAHKQVSQSNAGKSASSQKPRIYSYKFVPKEVLLTPSF